MSNPLRITKTINGETAETAAYSYPNDRISQAEYIIKSDLRDELPSNVIIRDTNKS